MPRLVEIGIDALFAALRDIEHKALVDLMVSLLRRNAYSLDEFLEGACAPRRTSWRTSGMSPSLCLKL